MNRSDEWVELYAMAQGSNKWLNGTIEVIRVPGGVLYKCKEENIQSNTVYHQTGTSINNEENLSVSITFAPFPPGLYEKLSQL